MLPLRRARPVSAYPTRVADLLDEALNTVLIDREETRRLLERARKAVGRYDPHGLPGGRQRFGYRLGLAAGLLRGDPLKAKRRIVSLRRSLDRYYRLR